MAAPKTVPRLSPSHNSTVPRHGVVTLFGYGIQVRVDRGHLLLSDGLDSDRRHFRLPRVGHGLRRLVVIGSDGFVSLAALRWLADQDAAFVMLDRDGSVLITTGPVRPSDARLRRAQALAIHSGAALEIARKLIGQKLSAQEQVVRHKLHADETADVITRLRAELAIADSPETVRLLESQAGAAYWSAWQDLPIQYPRNDMARMPEHWRIFGARQSLLSGSPRRAVNPPNAILNYLYAVLESEARLAAAVLGLDPGLGMLHTDRPNRDSLACDLMEPVRPQVDAYVLDWITQQPLRREWFFEQRDGNCRLMGSFAIRLSETAATWGRAVAPVAECVSRTLWSTTSKPIRRHVPPTHLTQRNRSEAKGGMYAPAVSLSPKPQRVCHACGVSLKDGQRHCASCAGEEARNRMLEIAKLGRVATHTSKAEALRSATQRRQRGALNEWQSSKHPSWLTEQVYRKRIQPALRWITVSAIASALNVSLPYATQIRTGRCRPHPRHWVALANLSGISVSV